MRSASGIHNAVGVPAALSVRHSYATTAAATAACLAVPPCRFDVRALLDFYKEPDPRVLAARQKSHEELKLEEVDSCSCACTHARTLLNMAGTFATAQHCISSHCCALVVHLVVGLVGCERLLAKIKCIQSHSDGL